MLTISGIGRLGRDPKMQYTPAGSAVTNISVAADVGYGEKKETVWVSLVAFSNAAEILNKYLTKGQRLVFTAEVTAIRTFTKRDNTVGTSLDAKILTFSFVDYGENKDAGDVEPEEF